MTEGVATLRRDRSGGWIAGVCAGIARRYGVDAALVRVAFVVATAAAGFGIPLYLLAWLVIPAGEATGRRRLTTGRGAVEVALGTALLLLSVLLAFRALGIWFSDAIVWPLVLIAGGAALIWRGSLHAQGARRDADAQRGARREREPPAERRSAAEPRRPPRRSRAPASASRS